MNRFENEKLSIKELQQYINQMQGLIYYLEQQKKPDVKLLKFYRNARVGFMARLTVAKRKAAGC